MLKFSHGVFQIVHVAESGGMQMISNGQQCSNLPALHHRIGLIQRPTFKVIHTLYRGYRYRCLACSLRLPRLSLGVPQYLRHVFGSLSHLWLAILFQLHGPHVIDSTSCQILPHLLWPFCQPHFLCQPHFAKLSCGKVSHEPNRP